MFGMKLSILQEIFSTHQSTLAPSISFESEKEQGRAVNQVGFLFWVENEVVECFAKNWEKIFFLRQKSFSKKVALLLEQKKCYMLRIFEIALILTVMTVAATHKTLVYVNSLEFYETTSGCE
jgi:hypothetical protein